MPSATSGGAKPWQSRSRAASKQQGHQKSASARHLDASTRFRAYCSGRGPRSAWSHNEPGHIGLHGIWTSALSLWPDFSTNFASLETSSGTQAHRAEARRGARRGTQRSVEQSAAERRARTQGATMARQRRAANWLPRAHIQTRKKSNLCQKNLEG